MQNSKDIQELIYRTIENISKELINKTNYLYLVEGKVTEIDTLGNCYVFKYQDEDYVGFSITGEKYNIGDLIYVLFSNNKNVKKMILSKTKAFSNNDIRRLVNSAQDSADEAKENAQEALDRIQEIGKDGNISPNEKLIIKKDWENIKIEYTQVTQEMELYGGSKNQILKPLKEQYDNNYIALKSYIEPILEDLTSSSKIDSNEFLEKFNNYYTIRQEIAQAIADITKTIADETQELAKINKQLLSDIANDDKLTSSEKQSVLKEFQSIVAEHAIIIEQARYYGLIYTDYDNSYNELSEYLSPLLENLNSTSDITGIIFRQYFINYYTERQKLQKRISDTAKDIADEAENIANEALQNTKLLSIEADGQIFSKTSNSEDFYPNYISLSVKTNVVTFDKFQYKTSNSDWQDVVSEEHGFTIVGESLTISKDSDLFTNSNNNITIQALSSDSSIKDIFTIIKVQDGVIGKNALSVILTNEAHVFPAGVSAALNSSTETEILAFDGASPVEVEVASISTLPSGLTARISNNNTLKPKITFTATTLLTEVKDVIITLRVKNTEIQKHFSYTLGLKGEPGNPGENAWSIVLGNDSQNIPCNSEGITNTTLTVDIPVYTFYGTLMVASTLNVGTLPSGVMATSITNGTTSAPGNVQLTFSNNISLGGKDSGTIDINVTASGQKFVKKFSWSKTKQGEDGISGEDGLGIKNIIEYYQVSNSNTVQPTSWIEEIPTMTSVNRFLWNYEKIIYTDDSFKETDKRVIGVYGEQGLKGENGQTSYTHIAYSNSADGNTDFSISDSNREYIGVYVDFVKNSSSNPSDYAWSKIKGKDGADGIPGKAGADGKTPYLHIAYANSANGNTGFSTTDSNNKLYIGQYTDFIVEDSTDPSKYSWTKIKGEQGEVGPSGNDGVGIKNVVNYYLATSNSTGVTISTSGWTTSIQSISSSKKYLWNYEKIIYTNNSSLNTDPCIIGAYGDKGQTGAAGEDGIGISEIIEYYQVSTLNNVSPTVWETTVPTLTATNKYLWNYEKITYTNGSSTETKKRVIGVYGDKGSIGETGNGIQGITNYYLASASSSGVTTSTSGWTTTIQSATSSKKYLWNYEIIVYTNGQSISTTPCIIGTYGDKGDSGRVYFLEPSSLVIKKGSDNVLNPSNITFQSYYRDGTSVTRTVYSGRFIIQESTDGNNYTTKYTSSTNENSKTYTPSSSNIKSIKCILCAAGGTTNQLDSQTVVVLTDIDNIEIGGRNLLLSTQTFQLPFQCRGTATTLVRDSDGFYYTNLRNSFSNYVYQDLDLKVNQKYTLSLYAKCDSNVELEVKDDSDNNIALTYIKLDSKDWKLYTSTFVVKKNAAQPRIAFLTRQDTATVYLKKIKLELGNKATDWTPAPEDIQENINNSKQEAIEASRAYIDVKEQEINSNVENIKTVVNGHTTAISTVQSSVQQTENKFNTVFTQTEEIKNLTDQNTTQLEQYQQYISMEPVKHEGEAEPRPTITLGQSTSSFKVAIDNKEIAFTGASGEKVAYITGDELRINNVVVVRKLAIGDFFLEQEQNGHLVLKKGR